jgi:hypothetical protein
MATRQLSVVPHRPFASAMLATVVVLMILTLLPQSPPGGSIFKDAA